MPPMKLVAAYSPLEVYAYMICIARSILMILVDVNTDMITNFVVTIILTPISS